MSKTKTDILEDINELWRNVRDFADEAEEREAKELDNDKFLVDIKDLVMNAEDANSIAEEAEDYVQQARKATERVLDKAEDLRDATQS